MFLPLRIREEKDAFRHTAAHIMAAGGQTALPECKAGDRSVHRDDGFYYDIDSDKTLTSEDFPAIEAEMKKIEGRRTLRLSDLNSRGKKPFVFERGYEPYEVGTIRIDLPEDAVISLYRQGDFTDLCAGPHLISTEIGDRVPGSHEDCREAYWRGSHRKNKMLTGSMEPHTRRMLIWRHVAMLEGGKRDHRKLGKELSLFMFFRKKGPGFPVLFCRKGMVLKNTLMQYWREIHEREGIMEISTPVMLNIHS